MGKCDVKCFTVSNGVRQCGVLLLCLFNVYMDGLSEMLNTCQTGCCSGVSKVNHLMYADDLVLLSPCKIGLSRLLKCCDDYAVSHDIVYNGSKSCVLIFHPIRRLIPIQYFAYRITSL